MAKSIKFCNLKKTLSIFFNRSALMGGALVFIVSSGGVIEERKAIRYIFERRSTKDHIRLSLLLTQNRSNLPNVKTM